MNAAEKVEARARLRDRLCPNCNAYFKYPGAQHQHAKETGHPRVADCHITHRSTRRRCEREVGHPGSHAYLGAYYVVYW